MSELIVRVVAAILYLIDLFLHLDVHLGAVIGEYGLATYFILFLVVFCETGLVVTPILPGDSLLFAAGTFAALGMFDPTVLGGILVVAAIGGDALNYSVGKYLGPKVLMGKVRFLKKEYLDKTQAFYERYGGKTIVVARFVPIVRTFAPFLAGVGNMKYSKFAIFNVVGALLWVVLFVGAGFFFGNIALVRKNFTLVILAIIFVSILPAIFEWARERFRKPVDSSV